MRRKGWHKGTQEVVALSYECVTSSSIDRRYLLEQTAGAHRYLDQGYKRGNVLITVEHNHKT